MRLAIALAAIAGVQRANGVCAVIDLAERLDTEAARDAGVDLEALLVSQPDDRAQGYEICDTLIRTGAVELIVVIAYTDIFSFAALSDIVVLARPEATT